jgi:parallel beta-helix repeat protein
MVSIIGPGTVTNYADGVGIASGSGSTVKGVDILSNVCCAGDGIYIGSPSTSDGNHIEGNTISSNAGSGIEVANGRGNEIIGNVIRGQMTPNTAAGILVSNGPGSIIKRNMVTGNSNGLLLGASSSFSTIIANDFSFSTQSGAVIYSGFNTILRNLVSNNTFSGISVAASGNVLRGNTADGNKRSGIALGDVCVGGISGNDNLIRGNRARFNVVDFFWDGQGTGNIWSHDTATTRNTPIPVISFTCP